MGGCSALNCKNSASKGFRCFSFPSDPERRMLWRINCRRDDWIPPRSAKLCEMHFERDQFELKRADGIIKLRPFAIPTIFNFSSPSVKKRAKPVFKGTGRATRKQTYWDDIKPSVIPKSETEMCIGRNPVFHSEAFDEGYSTEIITNDSCHDSRIPFIDDSPFVSDDYHEENDKVLYCSSADVLFSVSESDSVSVKSESNSIDSFVMSIETIDDADSQSREFDEKQLRHSKLVNKKCELRTEELEQSRVAIDPIGLENSELGKEHLRQSTLANKKCQLRTEKLEQSKAETSVADPGSSKLVRQSKPVLKKRKLCVENLEHSLAETNDTESESSEFDEKQLRQSELANKKFELQMEEYERVRVENSQLKKKIAVLNSFLRTLLPEEDIRAFEEAHFE